MGPGRFAPTHLASTPRPCRLARGLAQPRLALGADRLARRGSTGSRAALSGRRARVARQGATRRRPAGLALQRLAGGARTLRRRLLARPPARARRALLR